jgi:hypothetical protein
MYSRWNSSVFQTLLNMKYSAFKGTAYVRYGESNNGTSSFTIEADGKILYSSPEITKISRPIYFNVNITGYNEFKITPSGSVRISFADCGFYQ